MVHQFWPQWKFDLQLAYSFNKETIVSVKLTEKSVKYYTYCDMCGEHLLMKNILISNKPGFFFIM